MKCIRKISMLLFMLALPFALYSSGWYVGIEGGYSYNLVHADSGWLNTSDENGHGFEFAVPVEYKVTDHFSVSSGIRYIMKASEYTKTVEEGSAYYIADDITKMHHFLEIPLTLRFSEGNDFVRGFVGVGGYVGVRLFDVDRGRSATQTIGGNDSMVYHDYTEIIPFSGNDSLFDAGLLGEAGISFSFDDIGYLYLMGRYQYALTSLSKDYRMAYHTYIDNVSAVVGFMFEL